MGIINNQAVGISLAQLSNMEVVTYLPDEKIADVKDFFWKGNAT